MSELLNQWYTIPQIYFLFCYISCYTKKFFFLLCSLYLLYVCIQYVTNVLKGTTVLNQTHSIRYKCMHVYIKMAGYEYHRLVLTSLLKLLILGFQCVCVKYSSQIDICYNDTCLWTLFDFLDTPLWFFFFFLFVFV